MADVEVRPHCISAHQPGLEDSGAKVEFRQAEVDQGFIDCHAHHRTFGVDRLQEVVMSSRETDKRIGPVGEFYVLALDLRGKRAEHRHSAEVGTRRDVSEPQRHLLGFHRHARAEVWLVGAKSSSDRRLEPFLRLPLQRLEGGFIARDDVS